MNNNKVTLKEFGRAIPRLTELFLLTLVGYCVLVCGVVLSILFLTVGYLYVSNLYYPGLAMNSITTVVEWVSSHNAVFWTVVTAVLFAGYAIFARSLTIEIAESEAKK